MTSYFHFALWYFLHGRQMSDNAMRDPTQGCVPPASVCMFLVLFLGVWWAEGGLHFPKAFSYSSWPSSVVFTGPIKYVKPPVFSPHMYNRKIWLQLLLHPKGNFQNSSPTHLSEMKLSRFLRSAKICLLILNHASFQWMADQDKCLSYLFILLKMTRQLSSA